MFQGLSWELLGHFGEGFGVLLESLGVLFLIMFLVRREITAKIVTYSKMTYLTSLLLCF